MTLSDLYTLIDQKIYANGQRAITGTILNDVLKKMLQFANAGLNTNAESIEEIEGIIGDYRFIENADIKNGYLELTTDTDPRQVVAKISVEAILRGFDQNFPTNYRNALLGAQANAYFYTGDKEGVYLKSDETVLFKSDGIGSDTQIRIGDKEGSYYSDLFNSDYTVHIELRNLEDTQKYAIYEIIGVARLAIPKFIGEETRYEYLLELEHILGNNEFDYGMYSLKVIGFNKAGYWMNTEGIGVDLI